jgi:competence CoiA-like predicted nuclease
MLYAINAEGNKVKASPKSIGLCPSCHSQVYSYCGSLKVWHWKHRNVECDTWHEPETEWHIGWKEYTHPDNTEVVIGEHRADILSPLNTVIELQNSPISSEMIAIREKFYLENVGKMFWIINATKFIKHISAYFTDERNKIRFSWDYQRKNWINAHCPIFLDFDCETLSIQSFVKRGSWTFGGIAYKYSGANYMIAVNQFNDEYFQEGVIVKKSSLIAKYFQSARHLTKRALGQRGFSR